MICIALTGPPGSGKSSVRQALSVRLPAESLDIVDFFEPDTGFSAAERWKAFLDLLAKTDDALANGTNVVVEAFLFRPQRLAPLTELCAQHQARLVVICLTGELHVLMERVRLRSHGQLQTEVSDREIARFYTNFSGFVADLTIDTTHRKVDEVVREIEEVINNGQR